MQTIFYALQHIMKIKSTVKFDSPNRITPVQGGKCVCNLVYHFLGNVPKRCPTLNANSLTSHYPQTNKIKTFPIKNTV